jgi:protein phosphatase
MNLISIYGRTDRGLVRGHNEDHILVGRWIKNRGSILIEMEADDDYLADRGLLLAVADGVGGAAGGEHASWLGLAVFDQEFYSGEAVGDLNERVRRAAALANEAVLDEALDRPELANMAATLSGICATPGRYLIYNAGDSRVYRFRNGCLKQLSRDDTLVAHAVRTGAMSAEEATQSNFRHTITNCLGDRNMSLALEEGPEPRSGDLVLICSDGLHDLVPHERLEEILSENGALEIAADKLFAEAMDNGGHDNISVVLMRIL